MNLEENLDRNNRVLQLSEIIHNIYIGPWYLVQKKEILLEHGITHIVNVSELKNSFPYDFIYLKIDFPDDEETNISQYFTKVSRFIHNAYLNRGKILIHCFAGLSRSPTLMIAYLIQKRKYDLEQAFQLVKEKRPDVDINENFMMQLTTRFTQKNN
jgi:protein-tyrosine phosphatase